MGGNEVVIVQILAVVLILFFCFVTYMNTKTWRATHVTFLFLVFGAAIAFSVYASLIAKTRKAWQKAVAQLEKQHEAEKVKVHEINYGSSDKPQTQPGLAAHRAAIQRTIIDRGRVWRDLGFKGAEAQPPAEGSENATVVVNLRTAPADDRGEKADWTKMAKDTIVYAFKDLNPALPHTSYLYVGEFNATDTTETSITLTSTSPLTPGDRGLVNGNQPWILYERMPADSQAVFSHDATQFEAAIKPSDVFKDADDILWEYERDGMTLEEVNKHRVDHMQLELSPIERQERMFAEVKFLKDHKFAVDAGQAVPPDVGNADFFDSTGKALDPRLRRGGELSFKAGDTSELIYTGARDKDGQLLEKGAQELEEDGVLEVSRTIYRRPLNDYAYAFRHIAARSNQVSESLALVNKELAVVAAEEKAATESFKYRQDEKTKLLEDQTKLLAEKAKITKYAADLDASYRGVRSELSRLFKENAALHDSIIAANEKLTREIEARSSTTALER